MARVKFYHNKKYLDEKNCITNFNVIGRMKIKLKQLHIFFFKLHTQWRGPIYISAQWLTIIRSKKNWIALQGQWNQLSGYLWPERTAMRN